MNDAYSFVEADDLFTRQVTLFESVRSAHPPKVTTLGHVLDGIELGLWDAAVAKIRTASSQDEVDRRKRQLAAVKISGVFTGLDAGSMVKHSGLLCLDIDGTKDADVSDLRKRLKIDPYVLAFFTSPGGHGLKLIVAVNATDAETHAACFTLATNYFEPLLPVNTVLDDRPSNVTSNCFVSHDPGLWRATPPRLVFTPKALVPRDRGCGIDIPHVVESNEKELPSPPSPFGSSVRSIGNQDNLAVNPVQIPRPGQIHLPGVVETLIWAKFMKPIPYRQNQRNQTIKERVPILLNLVTSLNVEFLLLKWFDEAPEGMFKDSRVRHMLEVRSAIKGCLKNWPMNAKIGLSKIEQQAYRNLHDDRQRSSFRIFRSLSLAKPNQVSRTFFITERHLGERLGCPSEAAARQFEYLMKANVIALVEKGSTWSSGTRPRASRYRWMLC